MSEENLVEKALFDPPLWMQRRVMVGNILRERQCRSVLELGCGEGAVLAYLSGSSDYIEHLMGLDLNQSRIKLAMDLLKPTGKDTEELRERPLRVELYSGSLCDIRSSSVVDAETGSPIHAQPFANNDAIICMEVIEHLYKEDLDMFGASVLARPHLAQYLVVSTPNKEYNVHFPGMVANAGGDGSEQLKKFRDEDHKFEWTRAEFQGWCKSLATAHGYEVQFTGCGILKGKQYEESVGYATQCAIFKSKERRLENDTIMEIKYQPSRLEDEAVIIKHMEVDYPFYDVEFSDSDVLEELLSQIKAVMNWKFSDQVLSDLLSGKLESVQMGIGDLWYSIRLRQFSTGRQDELIKLISNLAVNKKLPQGINFDSATGAITLTIKWSPIKDFALNVQSSQDEDQRNADEEEEDWHEHMKPLNLKNYDLPEDKHIMNQVQKALVGNCAPKSTNKLEGNSKGMPSNVFAWNERFDTPEHAITLDHPAQPDEVTAPRKAMEGSVGIGWGGNSSSSGGSGKKSRRNKKGNAPKESFGW
ncbi:hypothetical protein MIR68_009087 [Amoeboaphelidium protococcarum]|nr:hypothetical protein MIR68_009087 [Amoeboaphelidium protococcarum]